MFRDDKSRLEWLEQELDGCNQASAHLHDFSFFKSNTESCLETCAGWGV